MEREQTPEERTLEGSTELYELLYGQVNIDHLTDKDLDSYNKERNEHYENGHPVFFANFGHKGEHETFEYYIRREFVGSITYSRTKGCEVMCAGRTAKEGVSLQEAVNYLSEQTP